MNETFEKRSILSPMELHLCMQLCGRRDYNDFPLFSEETPLEKRMLDAFLHLTALGILTPHETQYSLSAAYRETLHDMAYPDWKCVMLRRNARHVLYGSKNGVTLAETDVMNEQLCAVSTISEKTAFSVLLSRLHIFAQADASSPSPRETFTESSTTEQLLSASEAVLLLSRAGTDTQSRARIFIQDLKPWFSVLQKGGTPTAYCASAAEQWFHTNSR